MRTRSHVTKSKKAGIVFPVTRIFRYMKRVPTLVRRRIANSAAVYQSAVMEYLTREVFDVAGDLAIKEKKKIITPRHLMLSIVSDEELSRLLKCVTFPFSGVLPRIYPALLRSQEKYSRRSRQSSTASRNVAGKKRLQITTLSQRLISQHVNLCVVRGDLVSINVDAIVNPTNASMGMHGMVGTAIQNKGGRELMDAIMKELQDKGPLSSLSARKTVAPNMNCQYIIHCNGPSWSGVTDLAVTQLTQTVTACLELCDKEKLSRIALPSIGSGRAGYPKQLAAETILRAIKTYCDLNSATTHLRYVYFVLYDQDSINVYMSELARLQ